MITVKNLTKKFGDFTAVNNVTFEVGQGEIFAFLGPNGAGKSTTIKMLTTLLHPTSGQILLNGNDPVKNQINSRKSFGIVFQDPSIDDELTAYENMYFHGLLYDVESKLMAKRITELLTMVELLDRKDSQVKTFSGGMKRRLEIARGLLHHPKILFLDEPTVGLDPQTRNHIWSYIENLSKTENITIFFTTHYMEEADRVAQRVAIIDHGSIIESGTPEEIKTKTGQETLEDAFLKLTGSKIRVDQADSLDAMRNMRKAWGGRR